LFRATRRPAFSSLPAARRRTGPNRFPVPRAEQHLLGGHVEYLALFGKAQDVHGAVWICCRKVASFRTERDAVARNIAAGKWPGTSPSYSVSLVDFVGLPFPVSLFTSSSILHQTAASSLLPVESYSPTSLSTASFRRAVRIRDGISAWSYFSPS